MRQIFAERLAIRESAEASPADPEGREWDVALIRSGWSKNRRGYSDPVLETAAPLFENAKVCAYEVGKSSGAPHDHLPGDVEDALAAHGLDCSANTVGFVDGARFGEFTDSKGARQRGIVAKYHVIDPVMRGKLLAAWKAGRRDLLSFSINAEGDATPVIHDGQPAANVRNIRKVNSIEVVTEPAAGGEVLRLVASATGEGDGHRVSCEVDGKMKRLIHDLAMQLAPALVGTVPRGNLTDAQAFGVVSKLRESGGAWTREIEDARAKMVAGNWRGPDGAEGAVRGILAKTAALSGLRESAAKFEARFAEALAGMKKDLEDLDEAKFKAAYKVGKSAAKGMVSDMEDLDEAKFGEKWGFSKKEAKARMSMTESVADQWATLGIPSLKHKLGGMDPNSLPATMGPDGTYATLSGAAGMTHSAPYQPPGVPRSELDGKDLADYNPIKESRMNIDATPASLRESVDAANRAAGEAMAAAGVLKREAGLAVLERRLAESNLPDVKKARIRESFFDAATVTDEKVLAVIGRERDELVKLAESMGDRGMLSQFRRDADVEVGPGREEKIQRAVDGFFMGTNEDACSCGRMMESKGELHACNQHERVPRFRSFKKMMSVLMGVPVDEVGPYAVLREARTYVNPGQRKSLKLRESLTTGSWAFILGDSITRRLIAEPMLHGLGDWKKIVNIITSINDFRTNIRVRRGGYGVLPAVAEGATYTSLVSPTNEQATYVISKRGGLEDLTLEMIANDDVGSIQAIPRALGRAAGQSLFRAVFDPIINGDATLCYTGGFLNTVGQNNLLTTALGNASLTTARKQMLRQTAFGNVKEFLGESNAPKYLLIGAALEELALQLTAGQFQLGTGSGFVAGDRFSSNINLHSRYGLEPIVVPHWIETDATDNNWGLVANPRSVETVEVGFFQGQEDPELFVQDAPTVGAAMTADKVTFKIRHIYGVSGGLNFRSFLLSVVA